MASTGAEWKMSAANPTQDELKKWAAYCCARYTATTDTVWIDDNGEEVSLSQIFPKPDGQLGTNPTIFVPATPTLAELQDPVQNVTCTAKYKRDSDLVASIEKHIRSASVNISQMLVRTVSPEMITILRGTILGIGIMDKLTNPLAIINYIMATDYTAGAQLVTDPVEQYHKAKSYFESPAVRQKDSGESASVFAVRFNAEYQKVTQLAGVAGLQAQLMTTQLLTYTFLDKLNKRYDTMKSDYTKGVRQKPVTIAAVVIHALYWDTLPTSTASTASPKYSPAEKAAYAIQLQAKRDAKSSSKVTNSNIIPSVSKFNCDLHKTNAHVYNDAACKKAKAEYYAKKLADKALQKSA